MNGRWYAGVPHSHTTASDGVLDLDRLIKLALRNKLDYLIITDHNKNCEFLPEVKDLTLIYGTEYTKRGGHTNFWGIKNAVDDFTAETYEEWLKIKDEAVRRGAVVCMNHPLCSKCTWRWERNAKDTDVLEIWNGPMHYDNLLCTEWWHELLRQGLKMPVVGGSDYHRDYVVTNLLVRPTTYVYAESSSPDDILEAIKSGRTTICNSVGSTFINITCGENMQGDTVKISDWETAKVYVKKLKRNHTLHVFASHGECFTFTADKTGDYSFDIPVSKGFLCAHVTYQPSKLYELIYDKVIASKIPSQKGMKLPPLIYAQSGAIYFE